jgi:hypothetical protein
VKPRGTKTQRAELLGATKQLNLLGGMGIYNNKSAKLFDLKIFSYH